MLMGRAKAYSRSYPQAVTHRSTNRAQHRVTSFQPQRVTNYARGLKLVARGPHAAREGVICGPRHIIWNSKNLG